MDSVLKERQYSHAEACESIAKLSSLVLETMFDFENVLWLTELLTPPSSEFKEESRNEFKEIKEEDYNIISELHDLNAKLHDLYHIECADLTKTNKTL